MLYKTPSFTAGSRSLIPKLDCKIIMIYYLFLKKSSRHRAPSSL